MPETENSDKHPTEGFKTQIYKPQTIPLIEVINPIANIDRLAFQKDRLRWLRLLAMFNSPACTIAVLRSLNEEIVGFSVIIPIGEFDHNREAENGETAYISNTALHPNYQNRGLSTGLLDTIDEYLRKEGYQYVERHARINNGYAAKLLRRYGEKVLDSKIVDQETNQPRQWMRIRL